MGLAEAGVFAWQLAFALLPACAWLTMCKQVARLRGKVGLCYCIAAVLVLLSCLFGRYGLTLAGLPAGILAEIFLYVRWKKALKNRSLQANTIISFQSRDFF